MDIKDVIVKWWVAWAGRRELICHFSLPTRCKALGLPEVLEPKQTCTLAIELAQI